MNTIKIPITEEETYKLQRLFFEKNSYIDIIRLFCQDTEFKPNGNFEKILSEYNEANIEYELFFEYLFKKYGKPELEIMGINYENIKKFVSFNDFQLILEY